MRKTLLSLLLCGLIISSGIVPASAASLTLSDISGHWAQQDIEEAIVSGWVNGYPDMSFRPEGLITRAEFVKMLISAMHLMPDSETTNFLVENANKYQIKSLVDIDKHWLTVQGWMLPAQSFGLIVSEDYSGYRFGPDTPITRYQIVVMVDRALGLVNQASWSATEKLQFSDQEKIPQWVKGYVREATKAEVLEGYPDGSFGGSRTATRAEAVVMVARAMKYMETGMDKDIKVFVQKNDVSSGISPLRVDLAVPAQMIDGCIYVPVRNVFDAIAKLYGNTEFRYGWNPIDQILYFEYGMFYLDFRPGDGRYGYGNDKVGQNAAIGEYSPFYSAKAEARILYGELMVPIYNYNQRNSGDWGIAIGSESWNAKTKTLILPVNQVKSGE